MNVRRMKLFGLLAVVMLTLGLAGCSDSDSSSLCAAQTVSGYATAGAAIVGKVSKDANGTVKTADIGTDGAYPSMFPACQSRIISRRKVKPAGRM